MSDSFDNRLRGELDELKAKSRYRSIRRPVGINFGSNDYLGFAVNLELQARAREAMNALPLSASSSRLLPGHHEVHADMEAAFARFVGAESALYFGSGYAANLALLTTLATRHDLVLYDERSHASWYDSVHTTHAKSLRFKHNDVDDLKRKLGQANDARIVFIVIESVYSMDGDIAPVEEIAQLAQERGAVLIIDEAHATGVIGPRAAGLAASLRSHFSSIITVHTCGKALGSAGAVVAGPPVVMEYLVNTARQFIFTTALPPILALQVWHAIDLLATSGDELIAALHQRSASLRTLLRDGLQRWSVPDGVTPIIPVIVGGEKEALSAAQLLRETGFDVPAIRPPTVAVGTSRLRLNVSLTHSTEELAAVGDAILRAEREVAP